MIFIERDYSKASTRHLPIDSRAPEAVLLNVGSSPFAPSSPVFSDTETSKTHGHEDLPGSHRPNRMRTRRSYSNRKQICRPKPSRKRIVQLVPPCDKLNSTNSPKVLITACSDLGIPSSLSSSSRAFLACSLTTSSPGEKSSTGETGMSDALSDALSELKEVEERPRDRRDWTTTRERREMARRGMAGRRRRDLIMVLEEEEGRAWTLGRKSREEEIKS